MHDFKKIVFFFFLVYMDQVIENLLQSVAKRRVSVDFVVHLWPLELTKIKIKKLSLESNILVVLFKFDSNVYLFNLKFNANRLRIMKLFLIVGADYMYVLGLCAHCIMTVRICLK